MSNFQFYVLISTLFLIAAAISNQEWMLILSAAWLLLGIAHGMVSKD